MAWHRYHDLSGDSGITGYEIGEDFIRVRFQRRTIYLYDHHQPGRDHVERMKALARQGRGLATYISQHVGEAYARNEVEP